MRDAFPMEPGDPYLVYEAKKAAEKHARVVKEEELRVAMEAAEATLASADAGTRDFGIARREFDAAKKKWLRCRGLTPLAPVLEGEGYSLEAVLEAGKKAVVGLGQTIGVKCLWDIVSDEKKAAKAAATAPKPLWIRECHRALGRTMIAFVNDDDWPWDLYVLASVMQVFIVTYWPVGVVGVGSESSVLGLSVCGSRSAVWSMSVVLEF